MQQRIIKLQDKKWFRLIFNGKEWEPIMKAMALLREVEVLRKEN